MVPRMHEMNTLYDTPNNHLARHGRLLRVRVERAAGRSNGAAGAGNSQQVKANGDSGFSALLTFKGPVGSPPREARGAAEGAGTKGKAPAYKIREEHEIRASDPEELGRIMDGLGLRPCFRYEKFRTTYRLPGIGKVKVEFDETPIGLFLELEGPRREIDRAAARLGFGPADYIVKSYGELFVEERGAGPSRRRAGAKGAAGKSRPEPVEAQLGVAVPRERTVAQGVAAPGDEPARFSGFGDMLFRRSR